MALQHHGTMERTHGMKTAVADGVTATMERTHGMNTPVADGVKTAVADGMKTAVADGVGERHRSSNRVTSTYMNMRAATMKTAVAEAARCLRRLVEQSPRPLA